MFRSSANIMLSRFWIGKWSIVKCRNRTNRRIKMKAFYFLIFGFLGNLEILGLFRKVENVKTTLFWILVHRGNGSLSSALYECYQNTYSLQQENLLPHDMYTLIEILRKVENSELFSMDLRSMSVALLHRYEKWKFILQYFFSFFSVKINRS